MLEPYTKDTLEQLCKESNSLAEVLRKAGRKQGGNNQELLKAKIREFNIDISHFTQQGWSKGKTAKDDPRIKSKEKYSIEEVFTKNSQIKRNIVRNYILKHQLIEYKCAICGNDGTWQGKSISLELDHIDGVNNNNELSNLRFLCPNCHALTPTYRGRNIAKEYKEHKEQISEEVYVEALRNSKNISQALKNLGLTNTGGNYTRAKSLVAKYQIQFEEESSQKESIQCPICNEVFIPSFSGQKYCSQECVHKSQQTCERPSREELKRMIRTIPFLQISRKYGVTDNTIRKWCDAYNLPRRVHEIKTYSDEEWDLI